MILISRTVVGGNIAGGVARWRSIRLHARSRFAVQPWLAVLCGIACFTNGLRVARRADIVQAGKARGALGVVLASSSALTKGLAGSRGAEGPNDTLVTGKTRIPDILSSTYS